MKPADDWLKDGVEINSDTDEGYVTNCASGRKEKKRKYCRYTYAEEQRLIAAHKFFYGNWEAISEFFPDRNIGAVGLAQKLLYVLVFKHVLINLPYILLFSLFLVTKEVENCERST
jgi:hypothetical protein